MAAKTAPRHLDEGYMTLVEDLRGIVWNSSGKGKPGWGTLAGKARLCLATVSRFADGTTHLPTGNTIYMLAQACGYRIALVQSEEDVVVFGEVKPGTFKDNVPNKVQTEIRKKTRAQRKRAA